MYIRCIYSKPYFEGLIRPASVALYVAHQHVGKAITKDIKSFPTVAMSDISSVSRGNAKDPNRRK